jgi:hypothetical protein
MMSAGRSRVRIPMSFFFCKFTYSFHPDYGTGVESTYNRNEFVSARIRAGSWFKRFLCFILMDVRCFRLPPGYASPRLKATGIAVVHLLHPKTRPQTECQKDDCYWNPFFVSLQTVPLSSRCLFPSAVDRNLGNEYGHKEETKQQKVYITRTETYIIILTF